LRLAWQEMSSIRMFRRVLAKIARQSGCGFLCVTAFSLSALALNPTQSISQYGHTSWRSDAGIQTVRRIRQTPDGYLWLATRNGLMRFDGVRFATFRAGPETGLESSTMQDLAIDPDGSMWVATLGGGLASLQAGRFHTYTVNDGLPSVDINALFRDSQGALWIGTRGAGIARMVNGTFEGLHVPIPPSRISAFLEDADHSLWIATDGFGVFRLQNGAIRSFTVKDGLPANRIDSLCRDHAGRIWTAGWGGVSSWDGVRFVANAAVNAMVRIATACVEDRDRNLWIGTSSGLLRLRGTEVSRTDRSMGLSGDDVWDVFEDREGNLWAGTTGGLDRFRDEQVQVFTQPGPVLSDAQGVLTASNAQISRIAANTIRALPVSLPKDSTVFAFLSMPEGSFLIGSDKGVWIWTSQHTRSVPELSGLSVRSLLRARDGSIWIGTANRGLLRWNPTARSQALTETGVSDNSIAALAQDPTGAVWAGAISGAGLFRVSGGSVQHFGRDEGLRSTVIYSLFVDNSGKLWIGSEGGLSWFQDGHIRTLNSQQGLPADQVFGILDDSFNRIWLSQYTGIAAIDKKSLSAWASGARHEIKPLLYPFPLGLDFQSRPQFFPSAARSADGHLWFGNPCGLCEVTPPDPAASRASQFPVLVEDATVDGVAQSRPNYVRIPPGARSIEFRYTALELSNPEAIRFRYRLEGFDKDWIDAGTRRLAFYNNLKPGAYKFRVAASADQEHWQESSALVLDQIPFFYQTWWFTVLASASVLSLALFIYRLRLRQAVDRIQSGFRQRVEERTRIARELHDTLLQSFQGAVFQFQAARRLLLRNADNAMQVVDEAIQTAEEGIREGRAAIHDLRPEPAAQRDLPELLKAAGRELAGAHQWSGNASAFSLIVEGRQRRLALSLQDEVYRISREVIRNAFQHAAASRIEVEIHYDSDQLRVRIRDDGKGIAPETLEAGGHTGHWGIQGMRERAEQIGARLTFWSESGAGTEVELIVRAAAAYEKRHENRRFRLFPGAGRNG
jgi:ligand-binding sensor domain-containing protein/signal transduction histidine kinase